MTSAVGFDRVAHLVRVPVTVGGDQHRFLVDTGIGITVVSSAVAARSDVQATGESYAGRRMSGQVVEVPLVRLPALRVGEHSREGHLAGVLDLGDAAGPLGFDGILGPGFFAGQVVTTDPDARTLTVRPAAAVDGEGVEVPVEVRRDGPSWDPFTQLVLPSGRTVCVEVDTGSANLILATRYLEECGLAVGDEGVETSTGADETGHPWVRHHATLRGSVHLAGAPETAQPAPRVQFQDIVHDGLVGTDYLERFRFTFDVSGGRLLLAPRAR